jgi:D-alanyl-D-alanine carboxypeptidase/D-alanyl-D-alanine-endopeptidase (penicillin-binding protein 4)
VLTTPSVSHPHPLGEAGRTGLVALLSVLLLLTAGGYAAYDAGWLDRYLGRDADVAPAAIPPPEGVDLPAAVPPRPVLDEALPVDAAAAVPTPRQVRRQLAARLRDRDLGRHLGVLVQPLGEDRDLLRVGGGDLFTPASSLKLLTTATALELMGPAHRFSTTAVRGPGRRGRGTVVLVGGGDPLLTQAPPADASEWPEQATLRDLARRTARQLRADGVRRVRLGYDATLFTGPAVSPAWERDYVPNDVVSPISALWVDEGRDDPDLAARSDDPAAEAAAAFGAELKRAGLRVARRVAPTRAPADAQVLATVRSAPLAQLVQHVIEVSDNEAAEVLLRHAGLAAGRQGSFAGGSAAVRATLGRLGVDMSGVRIHDGSGLSRRNRLTLDSLVQTLQLAASPQQTDLRRVVSGLPVAGFNGSLEFRFVTTGQDGRGLVRAKTGTLTGVHALVGTTSGADGVPLVFAAVADRVRPIDTLDARADLDALTAAIATCC